MRLKSYGILGITSLMLTGCAMFGLGEKPEPTRETFLTLADVTGRITLKEDSPEVRLFRVKAKAFIKRNDLRNARNQALESAKKAALDKMAQELLSPAVYNQNYEKIEQYMIQNVDNYILQSEVNAEKKIFGGQYYGIDSAHKVSRQKTLVALQKDLGLIDKSSSALITVITSKKDLDLSKSGMRFSDIEDALMNQVQTDLNQRGLRTMDFRNAVTAMQTDEKAKEQFGKISKEQFMAVVSGSSADRAALDKQIKNAEEFYSTGLTLIQQMAKVVVEVNIFAVNGNVKGDLALSMNVTAKNISTGRGGAFANSVVNVARRGGEGTIKSAIITGLVQDAYKEMSNDFIPQVIKEMSTISVGGKKLTAYELVLKDFDSKTSRKIRSKIKAMEAEHFRYIRMDNSVPTITTLQVRYAGNIEELADKIMTIFDEMGIDFKEPTIAPELTDLVIAQIKGK